MGCTLRVYTMLGTFNLMMIEAFSQNVSKFSKLTEVGIRELYFPLCTMQLQYTIMQLEWSIFLVLQIFLPECKYTSNSRGRKEKHI